MRTAAHTGPAGKGLAVWFTGLSGAGKTTICRALAAELRTQGFLVQVLDADEVRRSISRDLGFSKADRDENVFRIASLAHALVNRKFIVLVAAISPYREARMQARKRIGSFLEVHVNASLASCIARDPKGLYARALSGELHHFTGIDDPYEPPLNPDVRCDTEIETCAQSAARVLDAILRLQPDPGSLPATAAAPQPMQ
jgi:adenylylsulfate kinase